MTTVILAEKPSQALAYAEAFSKCHKENGFFQVFDPLFDTDTYITFGFGHLVELTPHGGYDSKWEEWQLDTLPIFPTDYQYQVPKDKLKQFKIVAKLLKNADTIIIATDSDREGSNIAWSIIRKANAYDRKKNYKRLWINSLEKEAIREGFKNLRPGKSDIPAYKEAQTRQISDWLIGMNASPLYSLNLQKKQVSGVFSIGRVQTATLYMIYQRQVEIEEFVKTPYIEIEGEIKSEVSSFKGSFEPSQRFKDERDLQAYLAERKARIGKQSGTINAVEITKKETKSPSLFSLSSLQKKANTLFKLSAKETLKTVQALYEAKLLTYPRTDTPYITHNEFSYLRKNISNYLNFLGITEKPTQMEPRKSYVNDSKVQEHHAIILTKTAATKEVFDKLTLNQKNIYLLVAKTTVGMFLPIYKYEETVIQTAVGNLLLKSKGQVPLEQGWKILFNSLNKKEKETQPPKPYNEGSIIIAMKNSW